MIKENVSKECILTGPIKVEDRVNVINENNCLIGESVREICRRLYGINDEDIEETDWKPQCISEKLLYIEEKQKKTMQMLTNFIENL